MPKKSRTEKLEEHRAYLRVDYTEVTGKPFNHFFCPMLHEDKPGGLCMGHVINEKCPDSFGGRVLQRQDVDGWFGSMFERDFTTHVQVRNVGLAQALADPRIRRKMSIKIFAGEEELRYYEDTGVDVPGHTAMTLGLDPMYPVHLRFKKTEAELDALIASGIPPRIEIGNVGPVAAMVTLFKMAHLTLFRELGYAYGLSRGGKRIGHDILGRFYLQNRDKKRSEVKRAASEFFPPYINMMRVIHGFSGKGKNPVGTVEDGLFNACMTPEGTIFALSVYLRAAKLNFSVLVPCYETPQGQEAFDEFLANNQQDLVTRKCKIKDKKITMEERLTKLSWHKSPAFNFDE